MFNMWHAFLKNIFPHNTYDFLSFKNHGMCLFPVIVNVSFDRSQWEVSFGINSIENNKHQTTQTNFQHPFSIKIKMLLSQNMQNR